MGRAEADLVMLKEAFIETPDFTALKNTRDYNFVVGRRGTGKSALFNKLSAHFSNDSTRIFVKELLPQEHEILALQSRLADLEYKNSRAIFVDM